jgi:hypothetical protein
MTRRVATTLLAGALLGASLGATGAVAAGHTGDTVIDWNRYATEAIFNAPTAAVPGAGHTPPVGGIHMAMVQIAVYDAVNAIVGGHEPYLEGLSAPGTASIDAAVAVAAHDVLVGIEPAGAATALPPAAVERLGNLRDDTLAGVPDGASKDAGIAIGADAAAAILDDREGDGRGGSFRFTPGTLPGQWRPTAATGLNDPFAWVKDVRPFTLRSGTQYMADGPPALDSAEYAADYNEVKAYGSASSTVRSADQQATGLFLTENPFTLYNRSFRELAEDRALSASDAARFFAMVNVGSADAVIACWNNKAASSNWRPITAINSTEDDGNPATAPEPGWNSLVASPPYPDNTSGYNCGTGGSMYAARAFFGTDKMSFDLINAAEARRGYDRFSGVLDDTIDARVWIGLHFRFADVQGAWVGKKAGQWATSRFFQPVD